MNNILANPSIAVPASVEEITPSFLTNALRTGGTLHKTSVQTVEVVDRLVAKGMTSQISRVQLTYDRLVPDAPRTAIVKLSSANPEIRKLINGMGFYEREVRFYALLGEKVTFQIPRCYAKVYDSSNGMSMLLLEDLNGLENGDTIAGCGVERAESIVRMLAKFHAAWWNNRLLSGFDWLYRNNSPVALNVREIMVKNWEGLCQAIGDDKMPAIDAITTRLSGFQSVTNARMERLPFTLVHGDFQLFNLYFDPYKPAAEPVVADFQLASYARGPAYDLGFFIGSSVDTQVRRAHEAKLVGAYYTTLLNHGVQDYPYVEFLDDYRYGLLNGIFRLSFVMGTGMSKDRKVFLTRVHRYCAAIEDNQAWKVLETL